MTNSCRLIWWQARQQAQGDRINKYRRAECNCPCGYVEADDCPGRCRKRQTTIALHRIAYLMIYL